MITGGRGIVLKRCLKIVNLLLEEPTTIKGLSVRCGENLRTTYRYVKAIEEALGWRLNRSERQPRKYWIER